jgi:hypothetical protein
MDRGMTISLASGSFVSLARHMERSRRASSAEGEDA